MRNDSPKANIFGNSAAVKPSRIKRFSHSGLATVLGGAAAALAASLLLSTSAPAAQLLDTVDLGNPASETEHGLTVIGKSDVPTYQQPVIFIESMTSSKPPAAADDHENPQYAVDNNPETRCNFSGNGEWLQFTLNKPAQLEQVDIAWFKGDARRYNFEIQVSDDGEEWQQVFAGRSSGNTRELETFTFNPVTARHLRVVGHGNSHGGHRWTNSIYELRIGGLEYPDAYPGASYRPALGETCRRLLPPDWEWSKERPWGSSLFVTVKVDPKKQNYFTARFWGDERRHELGRLILLADGKLLSHTGRGDLEPLDITPSGDAPFPGRFYYSTALLPKTLTEGKNSVELEIRHFGNDYSYATDLQRLYYPVENASKGIYDIYVHTNPYFSPPADEKQGTKPRQTRRPEALHGSAEEMIDWITKRLNTRLEKTIDNMVQGEPVALMHAQMLAEAYNIDWSPFHNDKRIPQYMVTVMDHLMRTSDFGGVRGNPGGQLAEIFLHLEDRFNRDDILDARIEVNGTTISRREFYADNLVKSQESKLAGRRTYTNQVDWSDGGIYEMNRVLQMIAPDRAMPEELAERIVLEMVGLKPQSGDWPERRPRPDQLGEARYTVYTDKGLSRELGYVSGYGEMQGAVGAVARGFEHDPEMRQTILAQAHKVLQARTYFRTPHWDNNGDSLLRTESVIGCRHTYYPGRGGIMRSYVSLWDAGRMQGDPLAMQLLHRCIRDGRLFNELPGIISGRSSRDSMLLDCLRGWRYYQDWLAKHKNNPPELQLPLEGDDFVWSDEQNGVVVFKHGDAHAYVNFFFASGSAVNNLARVHFTTPEIDRLATMRSTSKVDESGEYFMRPATAQWTAVQTPATAWAIIPGLESYWGGEMLPIAKGRPSGLAMMYEGRYGDYYIAMNTTADKAFKLDLDGILEVGETAVNLVTGKTWRGGQPQFLRPRTTVVLCLDGE